jgi:hypothetical protein
MARRYDTALKRKEGAESGALLVLFGRVLEDALSEPTTRWSYQSC